MIPSARSSAASRDSASDEIDNINLAGSDAIADASFENFSNNFFLRAKGINGTRWAGDRRAQFLLLTRFAGAM